MSGPITIRTTDELKAWLITADNIEQVAEWCCGRTGPSHVIFFWDVRGRLDMVEVGEYLIQGVTGQFFVGEPDWVESSYEFVGGAS